MATVDKGGTVTLQESLVISLPGFDIDPYCGKWTYWFAPEVKNIIRLDDEDTENSFELVEYQIPDSGSR